MVKYQPMGRKENIVIQELDNEILIYDLNENEAFCLNETSAIIWQMCDGTKTVPEISRALGEKQNSLVPEDFVWLALEQLQKEKLISNEFKFNDVFAGMTRRHVIRKIGLGSMVALPIVASMIAPVAASAASTCLCGSPGDCLTQTGCPNTMNCNTSMVCAP